MQVFRQIAFVFAVLASVATLGPIPVSAQAGGITLPEGTRANSLKVKNSCDFAVWMQQQNITGAPEIKKLKSGKSYTYAILPAGVPSARVWPKKGCDKNGQNCKIGQTLPPCPSTGCQPAIDSLVEATFACVGPGCDVTKANTFYDISQVDGYTLPFRLTAKGTETNSACVNVNCSKFSNSSCPKNEDISSNGKYPQYKSVDLRARNPSTNKVIGCFSPCEKLTAGTAVGGFGLAPDSDQAILYCCPSFKDDPQRTKQVQKACLAGPVPDTKYVNFVHKACNSRAYAWAYDDINGNLSCTGFTRLTMEICPGKKKK